MKLCDLGHPLRLGSGVRDGSVGRDGGDGRGARVGWMVLARVLSFPLAFSPSSPAWRKLAGSELKATQLPPQFLSLSLWETGCCSIAASPRWSSATISSNRLRIAVSIIAAAPFARAIREGSASTSGMAFKSAAHSLPAAVLQTKKPQLQRRRQRKSLRTQEKLTQNLWS
jgi:hypothetical protein